MDQGVGGELACTREELECEDAEEQEAKEKHDNHAEQRLNGTPERVDHDPEAGYPCSKSMITLFLFLKRVPARGMQACVRVGELYRSGFATRETRAGRVWQCSCRRKELRPDSWRQKKPTVGPSWWQAGGRGSCSPKADHDAVEDRPAIAQIGVRVPNQPKCNRLADQFYRVDGSEEIPAKASVGGEGGQGQPQRHGAAQVLFKSLPRGRRSTTGGGGQ